MKSLITNIQRMCLDDGPGIRTTVFMKGCTVHCPWCSNPENIHFEEERFSVSTGCVLKKDSCLFDGCKYFNSLCEAAGIYGRDYSVDELMPILLADKNYYDETGGGVTFSGGEALAHHDYLKQILNELIKYKIHTAIETALFVPRDAIVNLIRYLDFLYIDVKILVPDKCKRIIGGNVRQFLENVDYLISENKECVFRVPCNDRYTLDDPNREELLAFFRKYKDISIEIFKTHTLGEKKYRSLGLQPPTDVQCNDEKFELFARRLKDQGNDVIIRKL